MTQPERQPWVTDKGGPLWVKCPACQASPGERCTVATDSGRRGVEWVHNARRDLAQGWT